MSSIRSSLDEFAGQDLDSLSDAAVEEDLAELMLAAEAVEAQILRRLEEIDRRRTFERDGILSTVSFLAARFRMARSRAAELVRMARALRHMPATREAFAAHDISPSAVRLLVEARGAHREAFEDSEQLLVDAARSLSIGQLQQAVAHWKQMADQRHGVGDEDLRARRNLHVSPTVFGMVRIDGDLDPENGETVLTALRAILDSEARAGGHDDRTPAQRRADALAEICRQSLDRAGRPEVAGERPHIVVTVGLDALTSGAGRAELDHTGPVSPETARRIACDASISRVIMGPRSEVLDLGRKTSVVPPALRRALIMRDKGCRFPGCSRPQSWCDAHHITHWATGGKTKLSNLILLCRRHHRLVHQGFRIEMTASGSRFFRPEDSLLEDGPPP